jgi:hypothetical protein
MLRTHSFFRADLQMPMLTELGFQAFFRLFFANLSGQYDPELGLVLRSA